ncbi:uncharacterized protein LOC116200648 [Punica granatum]|uniref:Uncharacterized protein LOC116200648 n=1 Tax=Punica granatum TaxID=22663 RepID=A0A6P8CYY4_PUNGR|nr:uncharacterized protein LOC116200648 [Punica granatum]
MGKAATPNPDFSSWHSIAREFDLLNQLHHIEKGDLSLSKYLKDFKSICDQLVAIRKPVSEVNKVFWLLEGLVDKYESFKIPTLRPPIPNYDDAVSQLKGYELRNKYLLRATPSHSVVFAAQALGDFRNSNRGQGAPRGKGSSNRGGYSHQSNQQNNHCGLSHSGSYKPGVPTCQICKRPGHTALKCYDRFNNNYQATDIPQALVVLHVTDPTDEDWHPDTGANVPVTNDPGLEDTPSSGHEK